MASARSRKPVKVRSTDSARAVGTTVALLIIGSGLAFGMTFLLGILAPGLPRDLRVPLAYVALTAPLIFALRSDIALFGFHRERLEIAVSSGLLLALATLLGVGKWNALSSGLSLDQAAALLAFTIVAFIEEGIFRGVLQTQLIAWLGRWRGLLTGVALFSLWHIPQRLLTGLRGADLVGSLVPVVAVGIVLGMFMLIVRNTAGPAIVHTVANWMDRL